MKKPIIRKLIKIETETIYDFKRKVIISPSVTGNSYLRFAKVEGRCGAKSQEHTHPGDEVVLTLSGTTVNTVEGEEYKLSPQEALCIHPGQIHTTIVTSQKPWIGVSAYCDDCSLMKEKRKGQGECIKGNPTKRELSEIEPEAYYDFRRKFIFSPSVTGNRYINFAMMEGLCNSERHEQPHPGDSIFLTLSGRAEIRVGSEKYLLTPQLAICVPPGQTHSFLVISKEPWVSIVVSCDECPLLKKKCE